VPLIWYVLQKTRVGLIIRAVGENHDSAYALGYRVARIRFFCILFGGAMAGLAGAFIVLVHVDWKEGGRLYIRFTMGFGIETRQSFPCLAAGMENTTHHRSLSIYHSGFGHHLSQPENDQTKRTCIIRQAV